MAKILDRFLLFIYSLVVGMVSVIIILLLSGLVPNLEVQNEQVLTIVVLSVAVVLFLLSIRFFYISVRRDRTSLPSVDQKTEYGDIQISMETIENLCLKASSKFRGVREVKSRIQVAQSGLEITIRAVVDGESSIPELTSELQKAIHDYVQEITGIPVSFVSVYIANLVQSPNYKSRVE
ncbi:alkaline shock response membrane anchor protein AmaP [Neobacillus mesonae]|nr:alkaline shock response membrane anchor protein AmaP [Neobacillus mesonae]